jgi:hypothetical protein
MNFRFLVVSVKWLSAMVAYLALSAAVSLALVLLLMRWRYGDDGSPGLGILMIISLVLVFAMSVLWGIIYASALASPKKFGSAWSVWWHFGLSHIIGLLSFTILWCFLGSRLPDFKSDSLISAYIVSMFGLSIACFLLAFLVRVHLSFRRRRSIRSLGMENAQRASTAS